MQAHLSRTRSAAGILFCRDEEFLPADPAPQNRPICVLDATLVEPTLMRAKSAGARRLGHSSSCWHAWRAGTPAQHAAARMQATAASMAYRQSRRPAMMRPYPAGPLGPAVDSCRGQDCVPEFRVRPSAEGGLGQEPLVQSLPGGGSTWLPRTSPGVCGEVREYLAGDRVVSRVQGRASPLSTSEMPASRAGPSTTGSHGVLSLVTNAGVLPAEGPREPLSCRRQKSGRGSQETASIMRYPAPSSVSATPQPVKPAAR
jgi:hypothetical protein